MKVSKTRTEQIVAYEGEVVVSVTMDDSAGAMKVRFGSISATDQREASVSVGNLSGETLEQIATALNEVIAKVKDVLVEGVQGGTD